MDTRYSDPSAAHREPGTQAGSGGDGTPQYRQSAGADGGLPDAEGAACDQAIERRPRGCRWGTAAAVLRRPATGRARRSAVHSQERTGFRWLLASRDVGSVVLGSVAYRAQPPILDALTVLDARSGDLDNAMPMVRLAADLIAPPSVGADGYLTQPFFPRELVARVRAMLRRPCLDAHG